MKPEQLTLLSLKKRKKKDWRKNRTQGHQSVDQHIHFMSPRGKKRRGREII